MLLFAALWQNQKKYLQFRHILISYDARKAIGQVAQRVYKDHKTLLHGRDGRPIELPGIGILTREGTEIPSMKLVFFSVGGGLSVASSLGHSYGYDSRFVKATIFNEDELDNPSVVKVNIDGSVVYNKKEYILKDPGIIPTVFFRGESKKKRIREIVKTTQTGLIVAEFVERSAADIAQRDPEMDELVSVRKEVGELTKVVGEVPLEEGIEAIISPSNS